MKKFTILAVMALVMVLALAGTAMAGAETDDTTASISFRDGEIVNPPDPGVVFPGMKPMVIDFGAYELPIRAEQYRADNATSASGHTNTGTSTEPFVGIAVKDSRAASAAWKFSVKASAFTAGVGDSFVGTIRLVNGTKRMTGENGTDPVAFPAGLTYMGESEINGSNTLTGVSPWTDVTAQVGSAHAGPFVGFSIVASDAQTVVPIFDATATLGAGAWGVEWAKEYIYLDVANETDNWRGIRNIDTEYQSTLIWSLEFEA